MSRWERYAWIATGLTALMFVGSLHLNRVANGDLESVRALEKDAYLRLRWFRLSVSYHDISFRSVSRLMRQPPSQERREDMIILARHAALGLDAEAASAVRRKLIAVEVEGEGSIGQDLVFELGLELLVRLAEADPRLIKYGGPFLRGP